MRCIGVLALATASAAELVAGAQPASAQSNRTFVSGSGSDANPCSLSAPCRSFTGALAQTNAGGEIAVLDTAGYGAVTITKAVSITNEAGVEAGITATSGDAITITASAGDVVNLRGLTLVGGSNAVGLVFNSGGVLNIQNLVVQGFSYGILLQPNISTQINISDTISANNFNRGVSLRPTGNGTTVVAYFERVQALNNHSWGFLVDGDSADPTTTIQATAADCSASGNSTGFSATSAAGAAPTTFLVVNGKAVNNGSGVVAGAGGTVILSETAIYGNSNGGYSTAGGAIKSFGNNFIVDTNNSGLLTAIAPK